MAREESSSSYNFPLVLGLLVLPLLLCLAFDPPHALVLAIFLSTVGLWLTEALPLPVTGLLVPTLAVLYGVLSPSKAFEAFGSDILFLFLGCFLMARAMEKHGFDKRLAYFLLGYCMPGTSLLAINIVIALAAFLLSMWISNTAATAILAAITLGILGGLEREIHDAAVAKRVGVRLLLTCAFAASIGGLATPVGSPPNLIALKLLADEGITISFFDWMLLGFPVACAMLIALVALFELLLPARQLTFPGIRNHFRGQLRGLGPMRAGEIEVAVVFLITAAMWIAPSILVEVAPNSAFVNALNSRLSMSAVGLLGGLAMLMLPLRDQHRVAANLWWEEAKGLDWGTLLLFGGGLTLGMLLETSGAAADIGGVLFRGELPPPLLVGSLVVVLSIAISEFASNTAAASILVPLLLGAGVAGGIPRDVMLSLVLAATFGASFGFMLPVSTPPNAIVYGTGRVPAAEMRRAGILFDLLGAAMIIGYLMILR